MFTILLHTSKTMRQTPAVSTVQFTQPLFVNQANELAARLKTLSQKELREGMNLSEKKAAETMSLVRSYEPDFQANAAIDSFLGDIFSGLQAQSFSEADRQYAQKHLRILSGLYGLLRPLDGIQPYRLEMGYKLNSIGSLYTFWGDLIAKTLESTTVLIDLTAKEYSKAVLPHLHPVPTIITPKFLTVSPKTNEPIFVTVHAKIARGAFAKWLIQMRIQDLTQLEEFNGLGYQYDAHLSTPTEPVYVAETFEGLGLSVRRT